MTARPLLPAATLLAAALLGGACAAPSAQTPATSSDRPWAEVLSDAEGQTVDLWMYGGDDRGNAYVDDVLAPAASDLGVTLRRVPVADTKDAVRRVLAERAAGQDDGSVDLVWVNGDNFATGQEADAWLCGWSDDLPNMQYVGDEDPLVSEDFGVPVEGCEAPWHKAQFAFVYDSARVPDPPTTVSGLLDWAEANPGRFTYPAPPDFTGSVFVRQALYALSGGAESVGTDFDEGAYDELTPALWARLDDVAPTLWRQGRTYPRDQVALDRLFADGQVDFTMTYGPATLTELVEDGTFPATTRVLSPADGTIGNASFLAIPTSSPDQAGAMVVADLALSPQQQAAKADPAVWGQFTVLDEELLDPESASAFDGLPASPVVPAYDDLSANAQPELSSEWVTPLDEGWRREVLGRR
ncbi:ABC transporter substrate-binding protein [Isoptericola jiangsuensis]|uniref:ABC transporter substrate-binding protein n=1 Tax=Isoptericola jiangsuensis TaxID=548579 RepID=UPI003AAF5359